MKMKLNIFDTVNTTKQMILLVEDSKSVKKKTKSIKFIFS